MTLKLNYQGTYQFSTEDIGDFNADPPIQFTAVAFRGREWIKASQELFADLDGITIDKALKMVSVALVSVHQNGHTHWVKTDEDARAVMLAIEESAPGTGEPFIRHLATTLVVELSKYDAQRKKKSGTSEEA